MANHSAQLVEHLAGLKPALLDGHVGTLRTNATLNAHMRAETENARRIVKASGMRL